jgi:hypothetical protein
MEQLRKDIEQFELAASLLDEESPTKARLALVLVDNVTELIMYRKARYEFARDASSCFWETQEYPENKRDRVLRYFGDKVNFLANDAGVMSLEKTRIIRASHYLRNEAYHTGRIRDDIIRPVTLTYFSFACRMYAQLWRGSYIYSDRSQVKEFLERFGFASRPLDERTLRAILNKVRASRQCPVEELALSVSEHLTGRIEEALRGLRYVAGNSDEHMDDMLKRMQFREQKSNTGHQLAESHEEFLEIHRKREAELFDYTPDVHLQKLRTWLNQARNIRARRTPESVLGRFWQIDKQIASIAELIEETVYEVDEDINAQVREQIMERHLDLDR